MNKVDLIKNAGIVGAGGAGFPSHVKLNNTAEILIVNGAECEPLLRVDQTLMDLHPDDLVDAVAIVMEMTQAKRGVICLKAKYKSAVAKLQARCEKEAAIDVQIVGNYYPAGDEQSLVYEVTGKVVPTGGLPIDVGAIVHNVSTLLNIKEAVLNGSAVVDKYVTITGAVANPMTINAPIGTSIAELLAIAGAPTDKENYAMIIGGPAMGAVSYDWEQPLTKTMGGVIVLPKEHKMIVEKERSIESDLVLAKAVCCQCNRCTDMCPRNSLGLGTSPHKVMRALSTDNYFSLGDANTIFSCCSCGLCTYYACDFGLSPAKMMTFMKTSLAKEGVRPDKVIPFEPDTNLEHKLVNTKRLTKRMDLNEYDVPAPLLAEKHQPASVQIPLKQHIGAPAEAVVKVGDRVRMGDLIGQIPADSLGAMIHASIDGVVTDVDDTYVVIKRD